MKKLKNYTMVMMAIALMGVLSACGTTNYRVKSDKKLGQIRSKESILILPPVSQDIHHKKLCDDLGTAYYSEIPKLVEGHVVYAKLVPGLNESYQWGNLIKNGLVNQQEVSAIAQNVGCDSVIVTQIIRINKYPPFRIILTMDWLDAKTGVTISHLYQDINLADKGTNYRFKNYSGQNSVQELSDRIFVDEDLHHTAYLMPTKFYNFAASYSSTVLLESTEKWAWWKFWNMF